MLCFFFFFYEYCHPRDLHVLTHSFPTLRSSDLGDVCCRIDASEPRRSGRTGVAARPNSRLWSYKGSERREGSGARAAGVEEISGRENGKGSGSVANRAECLTQKKTTGEKEIVKMLIDGAPQIGRAAGRENGGQEE